MKVSEMIKALKEMGFSVESRKRTDVGVIITKINNMTFTGSKGNQYARDVLGVELSQARIEQVHFNVTKYIKGSKKKATLDDEMKRKLRQVQRKWRKNKMHGRLTASKTKWHLEKEGRRAAMENLEKMSRYGEGLAYLENVEYLAQYWEDIARGFLINDTIQDRIYAVAEKIRAKAETFKESWIHQLYSLGYQILENSFDENIVNECIDRANEIIGG